MKTLALIISLLSLASPVFSAAVKPNIVFFFADDQRFDTLGCAGHPIVKTPNIDRLAADGVRFRNAFVTTSVCWVSRACVLTSQTARMHVMRNKGSTVKPESLADAYPLQLRRTGYRTAFFGKWHLHAPAGWRPEPMFDVFETVGRNPYFRNMQDGSKRHETDLVCDRGIEFIKSQAKDKPFCLNLWFNAAHAEDGDKIPGSGHHPWPPSVDGMYEDITIPSPRLGVTAIFESQPDFLKQSINRERFFWGYDTPEKYQANLRAYYRQISGIDHAIGRVLAALRESGLAENTIVVYSADNGYYLGDRGFQGKWSHYEESLRVPLVIHDPRLPKENRGKLLDQMALNLDLPATFLDWANASTPSEYEGRSLVPLLAGNNPQEWRKRFFCEHVDLSPHLTWEGIRGERYVYARYFDQQPPFEFLHDLQADPDQLKNLALSKDEASLEVLRMMRGVCDEEIKKRGGPLPPPSERGLPKGKGKAKGKAKAGLQR